MKYNRYIMSLKSYTAMTVQEHKHTTDFTHLCVHTRSPIIPSLISIFISMPLIQCHHFVLLQLFAEDDGRSPKSVHVLSATVSSGPHRCSSASFFLHSFHLLYHPDLIQYITPFGSVPLLCSRKCEGLRSRLHIMSF